MTIRHLKIFVEVCRANSITKAAENLNMAQPAVSNAIKELEVFYNVKLFERMNRRIYITSAGEILLNYANNILLQFTEIRQVIQDSAPSPIRIGCNVTFSENYLPDIISGFVELHPDIPLYIKTQNSKQIEEELLLNNLDFAIIDNPDTHAKIKSHLIQKENIIPVCSEKYFQKYFSYTPKSDTTATCSISDFSHLPILVREPGSGLRHIVDNTFYSYHVSPAIAAESISNHSLINLCLSGAGILFLSEKIAKELLVNTPLISLNIKECQLTRTYYLIYHQNKYLTSYMKDFIHYFKICHKATL